MTTRETAAERETDETHSESDFVLSTAIAAVEPADATTPAAQAPQDSDPLGELPRAYGGSSLFAMPRDPHTIFTYWDLDWLSIFGSDPIRERVVYLRALRSDNVEESRIAVEPMGGNRYVPVLCAGTAYRFELGYKADGGNWMSLAISDSVTTPADGVSEDSAVEVATVPFHLSFQRLVKAFRGSKYDGKALADVLADLQDRAASDEAETSLTAHDSGLLRKIGWETSAAERAERSHLNAQPDELLQERAEQMLARGSSGSSDALGGSSRGA